MERDLTGYIVQEGENPERAFDTADLDAHDGIFAVSREEWEQSPDFPLCYSHLNKGDISTSHQRYLIL